MTKQTELRIGFLLMAALVAFSIFGQMHDITGAWYIGLSIAGEVFFLVAGIGFIVRWLMRR